MTDKILLKDAVEKPMWEIICATEPDRLVDVRMTYMDLQILCSWINDKIKGEQKRGRDNAK